MKRTPLIGYRTPSYPLRGDETSEAAVARHVPARWRRKGKVAGAMALLFFSPPGGAVPAHADSAPPRTGRGGTVPSGGDEKRRRDPAGAPPLASVFEHGEGRGAFGCVAVAPPAFLTEADARQVILEEFARIGVKFELDKKRLFGVREKTVTTEYERRPDGTYTPKRKEHYGTEVLLDGYDPVHHIGFEYVSEEDYFKLGGEQSSSTVQSYDFRRIAREFADDAASDGSVHLGVFYDPMASVDWSEDEKGNYHAAKNHLGQQQLRAQVRDFIAWLRASHIL